LFGSFGGETLTDGGRTLGFELTRLRGRKFTGKSGLRRWRGGWAEGRVTSNGSLGGGVKGGKATGRKRFSASKLALRCKREGFGESPKEGKSQK